MSGVLLVVEMLFDRQNGHSAGGSTGSADRFGSDTNPPESFDEDWRAVADLFGGAQDSGKRHSKYTTAIEA
jgi:hypothetical protein